MFHARHPEVALQAPGPRRGLAHLVHQLISGNAVGVARAESPTAEARGETPLPAHRRPIQIPFEIERVLRPFGFGSKAPRAGFGGQFGTRARLGADMDRVAGRRSKLVGGIEVDGERAARTIALAGHEATSDSFGEMLLRPQ